MSYLVKPMQLDFLSNKDRENVFLSDEDFDDSFNFKYVSTSQFKHIIKDVRRQRARKEEKSLWASLLRQRDSEGSEYNDEDYIVPGVSKIKRLLVRENTEEVDQELKRLKEDALPERTKRQSKIISLDETRDNEAKKVERLSKFDECRKNGKIKSSIVLSAMRKDNDRSSSLERSPVSKLEYSTRTRKSQSERTLRERSESGDEFLPFVKHSEYNSCTGRSVDYESEKNDEMYEVRPHPVIAHKILAIQRKISNLLDEISFRLGRIPLPDGERDLRRRQQCVMEFAIRFSRNYLYDLGRQIADIRRHVRAVSPNARLKPSRRGFTLHVQAMEQKLTTSHQLLLQALNAYCKHIPSSVLRGQPGKLKEILQVVVDLRDICTKIHLTADYYERGDVEPPPLGKDTQNRCGAILSKLRLSSDNESQIFNRTVQSTPIKGFRNRSNDKNDNSKGLPSRLSMYNANVRLPSKNRVSTKHVTSSTGERRSSNNVRTIPQRYHPTTPEQSNPSPIGNKILRDIPKRSRAKIRLPLKEDEINTMMSKLPIDSDAGSSIAIFGNSQPSVSIRNGSITRRYSSRNPSSNNTRPSVTPTNEQPDESDNELADDSNPIIAKQLSSLVPVIADLMTLVRNQRQNDLAIRPVSLDSMQALTNFLRKYRTSTNMEIPTEEFANKVSTSSSIAKNPDNSRGLAKQKIGTRIGEKNMQLICLPPEEEKRQEITREVSNSSRITNLPVFNRRNRLLRVSECSLEALVKYRDDYRDWSRSNPMYTSKSQNKPWDVVAWIADKLVDELIVDVSKEFEISDVIQKLFELEFKEF